MLDKPLNVGQIIDKPKMYGTILLMEVKETVGSIERVRFMLCGLSAVLVREKIVYIYTYKVYEKEQDITDLKNFSINWLNQIAMANK